MKQIYLDHNATTPVRKEVLEAMMPYFSEDYGNASSVYSMGQKARQAVDGAREVIGNALGTEATDIIFTSGGTESDNFAIKGVAMANLNRGRHVITSMTEHLAVLEPCRFIEKELGFDVTYLPVDKYGLIDINKLKEAVRKDTILISIMLANNETGTIQPVKEIAKIARENKIYFHTDAVQALGKLSIDVEDLGIDICSFSGHKVYGPKGIGAMYLRKGVKITPFQHGGHHERSKRAGTENVPGIVGFAKAVEIAHRDMKKNDAHLKRLTKKMWDGLNKALKEISLNGHPEKRLPSTLNISFRYIEGESMVLNFDMKGISASTGSACTSGSLEPSHVLTAMAVPPEMAQGSVRFSFGYENTEADVDYCLVEIPPIVERLRKMSPLC
ncbi:MAG: cysteine desulfurase NifS [Candidatus Omnitrophica bacterium CG_4_9_14_0_2_um_filter_42_8]|nr:MAG: cysteine desulfurase NifS [Candidatus Omnitrophica bacterium CG22_combo_CG10-13_8_21_14_all_43_16]PJC48619.1 MAG: cysteine desulfurase NifS [Candidatus Omnitrophica bacterium CG_4_9_14_0_2_um_filter_42_8]